MGIEPLASEATTLPMESQELHLYVCMYEGKYDLQTISSKNDIDKRTKCINIILYSVTFE